MAAKKLTNFFKKLCTNREAWARFKKDPEGEMKKARLTKEHIAVVKSKHPQKVHDAVVKENPSGFNWFCIWIASAIKKK